MPGRIGTHREPWRSAVAPATGHRIYGDSHAECEPDGLDGATPHHHFARTGIWRPCKAVIGSVTDGTVRLSSYGHAGQSTIRSRQRLRKGLIEAGCRR